MSEMIERVARAICASERVDPDCMVRHGPTRKKVPMWTVYRARVRAAFEAMREPTPAMSDAGGNVGIEPADGCWTQDIGSGAAESAWRLMIAEALR